MSEVFSPSPKMCIKNHPFSRLRLAMMCMSLLMAQASVSAAEQDWWFDVEVIVFKRDTKLSELSEKFVNTPITAPKPTTLDLLTPYLQPDLGYLRASLPFCRVSERAKVQQQFEQDFAFPEAPAPEAEAEAYSQENSQDSLTLSEQAQVSEEDNFHYEVVSSDEFDQDSDNTNSPENLTADKLSEGVETTYDSEADAATVLADSAPERLEHTQDLSVNWIEWQIPQQLPCVYAEQLTLLSNPFAEPESVGPTLAELNSVPVKINGVDKQRKGQAFLLPQSELNLTSLFKGINKQHDLQTILHLGWRQEVKFGENKAQAIRLFAGKNYGLAFLPNGHKRPNLSDSLASQHAQYVPFTEQQHLSEHDLLQLQDQQAYQQNADLLSHLRAALTDEQPLALQQLPVIAPRHVASGLSEQTQSSVVEPIWEFDGEIKVYLQNVGRTPYLHIDNDFDFRQPVFDPSLTSQSEASEVTVMTGDQDRQANLIQSVNFKQFKRVISKQLHYFDHPLFGMVVIINRYNWPQESSNTTP